MFCESRGQLQYRIPSKEELQKQYEVGGILLWQIRLALFSTTTISFLDKYLYANGHPTALNILFCFKYLHGYKIMLGSL